MAKRQIKPFRPIYLSPAGLITSVDANGNANIITLGEVFNVSISGPVIVGVAITKQRYSHELISLTREFVVNLPTAAMAATVDRCGCCSGREVNKFAAFGLTALPAEKVRPPLIAECPVNLECTLLSVQEVGDHDLFLGEVLVEHVDEAALDASGKIDVARLDPLCYLHGQYYTAGRRLGPHGYTRKP